MKEISGLKNIYQSGSVNAFDIYKTDRVVAPDGYEFTGEFRTPSNEPGLNASAPSLVTDYTITGNGKPRLILRKLTKKTPPNNVLLTFDGRRWPRKGDWFRSESDNPEWFDVANHDFTEDRNIYKKVEF